MHASAQKGNRTVYHSIGHNPFLNAISTSLYDFLVVLVVLMAIGSLIGAAWLRWR